MQKQENHQESSEEQQNELIDEPTNDYILDPYDFLCFAKSDKKIKIMDQCNPIMPNVYLKDISLHKKGPMEDKMYAKFSKYFKNIRRGNTLCQIYDQKTHQPVKLFFCRRGMVKFYDLEPEYLKVNFQLTRYQSNVKKIIFSELDQCINSNSFKIHLYRLFKQNGQHCQISHVSQLGCWLFASKNVSILARNKQDLNNNYHKQRFYWAKLIGQQFFNIINSFSQQQKQQFINQIQGKTLLGQHCGNQNHQHITTYDKVQIIFYAIVQNQGTKHCVPVQQCQAFLQKFGLKMSKMKVVKNLQGKNQVYQNIYKMLEETATGTMEQQGEGSVLYIVGQEIKSGKQMTISLCKLKTSQYLILRKLRQMLKINATKKGATANSLKKYIFDIENMVSKYFKPPKPLKIYFKMAQNAFKEVRQRGDQIDQTFLRYKFSGFLSNLNNQKVMSQIQAQVEEQQHIMKQKELSGLIKRIVLVGLPSLNNKIQKFARSLKISVQYSIKPNQMTQKPTKTVIHILTMVPRIPTVQKMSANNVIIILKYSQKQIAKVVKQLSEFDDIKTKPHLISFLKSQDKQKSIVLLYKKMLGFVEQSLKEGIKCTVCDKQQGDIDKQQQVIEKLKEELFRKQDKQISVEDQNGKFGYTKYVVLPLLIPGSGKSVFSKELQLFIEQNHPQTYFKIIHSDGIRKSVIDKKKEERQKNAKPQLEQTQWFKISKQEAASKYKKAVQAQLDRVPQYCDQIVVIDRVVCPTTLQQNLQQYYRPYVKFVLLTQSFNPFKLSEYEYPFALRYLLTCLKRCVERQNHETLTTKPHQIAKVVLKYFQMYRNFNLSGFVKNIREQSLKQSVHKIIQLEFVKNKDQKGANMNNFLKKKVQECLKLINPGFDPKESDCFTELIEMTYKYIDFISGQQENPKTYCKQVLVQQFWTKLGFKSEFT